MGGAQGGRVGGGRVDSTCDVTPLLLATTATTATTGGRNRESGWTRGGKQLNDARLISKWDTVTSYQQRNWEGGGRKGIETAASGSDFISALEWIRQSCRIAQDRPGSTRIARRVQKGVKNPEESYLPKNPIL